MDVIFPNGVKILAKKYQVLNQIPTDPSHDRMFINTQFFVFFKEKYIRKQIKKHLNRKTILDKLRESVKYDLMRSIYEHRVLSDGMGDNKARIGLFRSTFRIKFNNWWGSNSSKTA